MKFLMSFEAGDSFETVGKGSFEYPSGDTALTITCIARDRISDEFRFRRSSRRESVHVGRAAGLHALSVSAFRFS